LNEGAAQTEHGDRALYRLVVMYIRIQTRRHSIDDYFSSKVTTGTLEEAVETGVSGAHNKGNATSGRGLVDSPCDFSCDV
jgi:hypothetical protein